MQQRVRRRIRQSSPVLNTVKLKSDIVSLIGEDRISRSILKDGSAGISCWKSYVSPTTGEMNITVNYKIMIPLRSWAVLPLSLKSRFKLSSWTGYQDGGMGGEGSDIVYMDR